MTITEWLTHARERLAQTGCPDPDVDARWIAEDALGMTRQDMVFEGDRAIPRAQLYTLESMLDRRAAGEPVQYILGSADFMGLRFRVDHGVLIPRQDTETLVEAALIELRQRPGHPTLLDLCCGSGCVGLSLASLAPHVHVTLADISPEALEIAKANQKALEVRAELKQGDLFNAVGRERFDVITANPPYIPSGELARRGRPGLLPPHRRSRRRPPQPRRGRLPGSRHQRGPRRARAAQGAPALRPGRHSEGPLRRGSGGFREDEK